MSKLAMVRALATAMARVTRRRLSRGRARPTWSFSFEVFADVLKQSAIRINALETTEQSAAWMELSVLRAQPVTIGEVTVAGMPAWWVARSEGKPERTLLYLHGGWYSSAALANYREFLGRLALACGTRILAIEYRKAPEHPFPAAIEDTLAAWRWLAQQAPGEKLLVAGDSAGAGLALALMLTLRDQGEALPAGAALLCPWVDLAATGGSLEANAAFDWGDEAEVQRRVALYLGDRDPRTPLASPVNADLHGLPRLLIQTGSAELLYDQAVALNERARRDGVEVTLDVAPDMIHDWQLFAGLFPEGRAAIRRIARFVSDS